MARAKVLRRLTPRSIDLYDGQVAEGDSDWDEDTTATDLASLDSAAKSQAERNRACLTVITGTAAGQMFRLPRGDSVIGRAPNAEIRVVDDGVSRHHARVRCDSKHIFVGDLESRNGTYINGQRILQETALEDGDKIQVGRSTVLRFAYHDELDDSFHDSLMSSALRDPLTKLFNKRYLLDRLDSELKFAKRHDSSISLLMIDIDHFKKVNDTHGHLAGDAVLAHISTVLSKAIRNEDVIARFGGEELVVILRATSLDAAALLAERLRKLVEATVTPHQGRELRTTVSIGVGTFPSPGITEVDQLIDAADKALYRAKHGGRNRVER
jgi:diguanylate cyclase (GGDEF)-like protein